MNLGSVSAVVIRRTLRTVRIAIHILAGVGFAGTAAFLRVFAPRRHKVLRPRITARWLGELAGIMGMRLHVRGQPIAEGPVLFAANHISWLDVVVLSIVCDASFVAKQEVRAWPLFGWFAREGGTLFVKRGDGDSARKITDLITWQLVSGGKMVFFPEGTSSRGDELLTFRSRLFQAAIRAECPVQPVALYYHGESNAHDIVPFVGEDALLTHLWRVMALPSIEVTVDVCEPIAGHGGERRELADAAWRKVADSLSLSIGSAIVGRTPEVRSRPTGS